jgi:hypothetical protein
MAARIMLAGLLRIELPGHDARLSDGGAVTVAGETYRARDARLGVVDGLEALTEGVADEAPAALLRFLPPDDVAAATLNDPAQAGSRVRLWTVEVDAETGAPIGAPEQEADWIVDFPALTIGIGERALELACVSGGDRLFQRDRGNSLAPNFHRSIFAGEAGLDNASGVETAVPWGAPSPARGVSGG